MGSVPPCCVDYWRAVHRPDPPRELSERERLLQAAHREANNIWASAHLITLLLLCWSGVCVCAATLAQKKQRAVTSKENELRVLQFDAKCDEKIAVFVLR